MDTLFVGKNFVELPEVGSTNSFATKLLESQPSEGTVVWSHAQTAGRGQQNNQWFATPGANLTFSIILFPRFLSPSRIFALNKVISIALCRVLRAQLPEREVLIKWPNDILVDRKKIAGILVENQLDGRGLQSSILGIGLNVNEQHFPEELQAKATSMALEGVQVPKLRPLLSQILQQVEALYLQLRSGKTFPMDREYLEHLYGYQEHVDLKIDGKMEKPMLVGVDLDGRLALERGGKLHYYQMKSLEFVL